MTALIPTPLAALSHEFRTPLNAVLGMARLLEGTRLSAEQKTYVEALRQSGDHLLSLVNDVLDLARLDAGEVALNTAPMRLDVLLQSVAELLSPRAHAKGLEIAWAVPAGLPPVIADEGRLRQVLFNLAGNAVKFTQAGGVLLGVEAVAAKAGRVTLRLTVSDTGPGVAAKDAARIFQPFVQGGTEGVESTGLGLAIVERLARAHGGRAGVESERGQGACFWFEAAFETAGAFNEPPPLGGILVAIASSSPVLRQAAAQQVRAGGGTVVAQAANAQVALIDHALARPGKPVRPTEGKPSLILLKPEERGRIARYRKAGFAGYLIKPLRQASLAARVLAALGREEGAAEPKDERALPQTAMGARVLLVEDNPVNALLAAKLLEREGCTVERAASGEEAIEAASRSAFDLILMDRRLPGMDGLGCATALRKGGTATPIVALTADAFEEDRRACLAAGMDDFLTKPLDPAALRAVMARALSGGWTNAGKDAKLAS